MFWLHSFSPPSIALRLGPLQVHYYGLTMALAMLAGIAAVRALAKRRGIKAEVVYDLAWWLIIGALVGARLYAVLLFWRFYLAHPLEIIAVWHGGLAIHGAMIGGAVALWWYCARHPQLGQGISVRFLRLADLVVPGLALGQAIGRWGNYFNQELYGRPTDLPWGIPISLDHRAPGFEMFSYFHPTFLYESILNLLLFGTLFALHRLRHLKPGQILGAYLIGYAAIRIAMEYLRLDETPLLLGLRWPVVVSLLVGLCGGVLIFVRAVRSVPSHQG